MIKKVLIFTFLFILSGEIKSQNLEGISGLFYIPTADINIDGQFTIGTSYLNKNYISFGSYQNSAFTPFITINYLPFLEISVRITRLINYEGNNQAIGDRTVSTRVKIFNENEILPAVVIGFHDILSAFGGVSAIHNSALYIVGSKNIFIYKNDIKLGISTGYGTDFIKAQHHNFIGLFGGLSFTFYNFFELMNEYDGKYSNGGVRIKLFDHFTLLAGFLRYKHFSGGASVSWVL